MIGPTFSPRDDEHAVEVYIAIAFHVGYFVMSILATASLVKLAFFS